jgi:hypothetical protein
MLRSCLWNFTPGRSWIFMRARRSLPGSTAGSLLIPGMACKQDEHPSKIITWICPHVAGGNIGADAITEATPDGDTIGMANFAPAGQFQQGAFTAAARLPDDGRSRFSGRRGAQLAGHRRPQRPAGGDHRVAQHGGQPGAAGMASLLFRGTLN